MFKDEPLNLSKPTKNYVHTYNAFEDSKGTV